MSLGIVNDVAALVSRVGGTANPAAGLKVVEDRNQVALVDPGAAGQARLAGGAELGERGKHHEVILAATIQRYTARRTDTGWRISTLAITPVALTTPLPRAL